MVKKGGQKKPLVISTLTTLHAKLETEHSHKFYDAPTRTEELRTACLDFRKDNDTFALNKFVEKVSKKHKKAFGDAVPLEEEETPPHRDEGPRGCHNTGKPFHRCSVSLHRCVLLATRPKSRTDTPVFRFNSPV